MTRALASMLEAAEFISSGRHVVLVIQDIEMGARISGDVVSMNECKDLNRARHYLRDIYRRHIGSNVTLCEDINEAVSRAVLLAQMLLPQKPTLKRVRSLITDPQGLLPCMTMKRKASPTGINYDPCMQGAGKYASPQPEA